MEITKEQVTEFLENSSIETLSEIKVSLSSLIKSGKKIAKELVKERLISLKEEANSYNRDNVKEGSYISSTYLDKPIIGFVVKLNEKTIIYNILDETGQIQLISRGEEMKTLTGWRRYSDFTIVEKPNFEEEKEEEEEEEEENSSL